MFGAFDIHDRVAVVTGAGAGLGRAVAMGLAQAGARVVVADCDGNAAQTTVEGIVAQDRQALAHRCDIACHDDVIHLFETIDRTFGSVDILVNNAGVGSHVRPEDLTEDAWQHVLDVNVTGSFLCAQQAGRRMIPRRRGSIINVGSIGGVTALGRGNFVYDISKAALHQMTRELAVEWGRHNVRVNAVLPCQFRTAGLQNVIDNPQFDSDALIGRFLTGIPLGRLGEPGDLVGPIIFLASDAAAMVTGTLLPVDGGNLALNAGGSHFW